MKQAVSTKDLCGSQSSMSFMASSLQNDAPPYDRSYWCFHAVRQLSVTHLLARLNCSRVVNELSACTLLAELRSEATATTLPSGGPC